jgi:hypothetical protein
VNSYVKIGVIPLLWSPTACLNKEANKGSVMWQLLADLAQGCDMTTTTSTAVPTAEVQVVTAAAPTSAAPRRRRGAVHVSTGF